MNFDQIVSEELATDLDAIKAQIKQLQASNTEKDTIIKEKDDAIKSLQDRLAKVVVPKKQEPKTGIGTRRSIQSPSQAPSMTAKI
jgi:hypothetical protein